MNAITNMRPVKRIDSRQCECCGAVYGRCEHTEGQTCEDVIWIPTNDNFKSYKPWNRWDAEDDARLRAYVTETKLHFGKIADLMNKTRSACIGRANRLGFVRREW